MSDSEGDLLVAETRVGGVQYGAHARRRIEEFEVAVGVFQASEETPSPVAIPRTPRACAA